MSKIWVITLMGLFVALVPFLGFPNSVRTVFVVVVGLGIAIISLRLFIRSRYAGNPFMEAFKGGQKIDGIKAPGDVRL